MLVDDFSIPLAEEIISAAANIEMDHNSRVDYVGLSYDALLILKKDLEDVLDRNVSQSDINNSLTIETFIIPGLVGVDYKFFKELRNV